MPEQKLDTDVQSCISSPLVSRLCREGKKRPKSSRDKVGPDLVKALTYKPAAAVAWLEYVDTYLSIRTSHAQGG